MKLDSRLSSVLHLLLHMADASEPLTSERLAGMLQTNPVLVRRTLAGLRERGLVTSEKGHGGGWELARPLDAITLHDVYAALGEPQLFAIGHRREDARCLVEQAVNAHLDQTLSDAEAFIRTRLRAVTLLELADDVRRRHPHAPDWRSHVHAPDPQA